MAPSKTARKFIHLLDRFCRWPRVKGGLGIFPGGTPLQQVIGSFGLEDEANSLNNCAVIGALHRDGNQGALPQFVPPDWRWGPDWRGACADLKGGATVCLAGKVPGTRSLTLSPI